MAQLVRCVVLAFALLGATVFGARTLEANPAVELKFEAIKRFSPRAKDELVNALVEYKQYLENAQINSPLRLTHFLAQIATETGGIRRIDENMNYSGALLLHVFGSKRISPAMAQKLSGKPQAIANYVYGDRLGNRGRDTNDGWDYRGSGFIQLTGRLNFRNRGREVGLPLEERPELARRPSRP